MLRTGCALQRIGLLLALSLPLAGCSERLQWRELRSADGYTVLLPGRAQTVQRDVAFDGLALPVTMTSAGVGATMFAVGVVRLPAAAAQDRATRDRVLAHFRDALVRNIRGSVMQAGTASLAPLPAGARLHAAQAVEARGTGGDGRPTLLVARFFIVDDRLFEVIAMGAAGSLEPLALETFFTSFRLQP
jgi:hypothetical protein